MGSIVVWSWLGRSLGEVFGWSIFEWNGVSHLLDGVLFLGR
jgi:hypothetical protein